MKLLVVIRFSAVLVMAAGAVPVHARDVSAQQAGVEYARQGVEQAEAQNKADMDRLADAEKLLAQRKRAYEQQIKQVEDDRRKAEMSRQQLQESKSKLSKAQAILDRAWKEK